MSPFYVQDFGSSLISLLWMLFQESAYFLFICLVLWVFTMSLHLLHVSAFSFCLVYCIWGLLSVDWKVVVPLNCGIYPPWMGLDRCSVKVLPVGDTFACVLVTRRILSLWRTVPSPVVCFAVSMGLVWLWAARLLMCRVVSLFCWRISMGHLPLELGEVSLINIPWSQGFSGGSKSWAWVSHLRS